ncbi:MAG: EthD family reductase [Verrucomicrobiota bacterium]
MYKRLTLFRRKNGMSVEEFRRHWSEHRPMAAEVPGLLRFVQNYIQSEPFGRPGVEDWDIGATDGIAETWWDSEASYLKALDTPELKRWYAHGASFIGQQKTYCIKEEVVVSR